MILGKLGSSDLQVGQDGDANVFNRISIGVGTPTRINDLSESCKLRRISYAIQGKATTGVGSRLINISFTVAGWPRTRRCRLLARRFEKSGHSGHERYSAGTRTTA